MAPLADEDRYITGSELSAWMRANFVSAHDMAVACRVPKTSVYAWARQHTRNYRHMPTIAAGSVLLSKDKDAPGSADWVRKTMDENGMKSSDLANLLGIHRSLVNAWRIYGIDDEDVFAEVVTTLNGNRTLLGV